MTSGEMSRGEKGPGYCHLLFVCLFVCLFVFPDRISLCSPGCPPGTHYRPVWPQTQRLPRLCLQSAGIKDLRNKVRDLTELWDLAEEGKGDAFLQKHPAGLVQT